MALVQPYLLYCIPLWGALQNCDAMSKLFILQKKCIRIITNHTNKVDGTFQHTKPLFRRMKILTVFNLYYYMCALEAMKIATFHSPTALFKFYTISERSRRLLLPKFSLSRIMKKSFIYNSSKILNYLIQHVNYK